ncbi:DUF2637 domain-containing protein [Streptomyces lasalocidi]|uniref:DUF2637 domain-containing protein n=1 Tax=Streptomyces lasalocidi TaxID=324833 RepID=A0A4U5WMU3_STRLS|nr:DUF2637 domain-containing protein [Streptomyces lasalocidi]TKT03429.1 DUF2637 domain-containing protein [Streptomyces lasalocidi]
MNKSKIMQWTGFGLVLIVALAVSWYSMATMAMDFFGLPKWLAYGVSVAFDGAAIYVAVLSSEYSKTEDSGLTARLATLGFVGVSAWLNYQHAVLMGLGVAGQVFFLAPPVVAGILFELFLRFENRKELRKRGRVAQAMPVYGKAAWLRYPLDTFKGMSSVIKYRLESVTRTETAGGQMDTSTGQVDKTEDASPKPLDTKPVSMKKVDVPKRTRKKVSTPTVQELEDTFPELTADMSIAKLAQAIYKQGVESRPEIQRRVSVIKGQDVPLNTICKSVKRLEQ